MRLVILAFMLFSTEMILAQTKVSSPDHGELEFNELDHGLASTEKGIVEEYKNSPSGTHGWLKDFVIIKVTDSIQVEKNANFGVVYMIKAQDTVDIAVDIEWIFPKKIKNDKGEKYKSIRYSTRRPTNIISASSYNLDQPYELVKGDWTMNIYLGNKLVNSRTFILY